MSTTLRPTPVTTEESFSFYVPASRGDLITACADLAEAVTVGGPKGPTAVRALRASGWDRPVIFDRWGYNPKTDAVDPAAWFHAQDAAGADRVLTAGTWVPWDETGETLRRALDIEAAIAGTRRDATVLIAVDHRWVTRRPAELAQALAELDQPVAIVLAHVADPLSETGAVAGLITMSCRLDNVSLLRTDHGGLGAVVYGAKHAAIGLAPGYRHFVPPGRTGGGKRDDRTVRVFVRQMLDWFTALTIAGWGSMAWQPTCPLRCCDGRPLARFFDPPNEPDAPLHNRLSLASLASEILDAPIEERRQLFAGMCHEAVDRYGPMGKLSTTTTPKGQLSQWAFA